MKHSPTLSERIEAVREQLAAKRSNPVQSQSPSQPSSIEVDSIGKTKANTGPPVRMVRIDRSSNR